MARAKRHVGKPAAAPEASTALEDKVQREPNKLKKVLLILGPGLITGASDDDPSGIGTYAVAGASFGFATLWTALFTFPLMTTTQVACARIAHVTGRGIAGVLRHYYGRWLLMPVVLALFVANTLNAGADLGAIAAAINLLVPVPIAAMIVPIALLIVALQFVGSYQMIAATFKWLTLVLLAYVAASAYARPGAFDVIRHTFVPTMRFNREFIAVIVAILGTTISPYLWFWQASEEIEEEIAQGRTTIEQRKGASASEKRLMVVDTSIGMFVSNVVMYFIILTTAATLFTAGKTDIASAADAAEALRPLAGDFATVLLAVGLIGSGLLAIPILTGSAAYAASEGSAGGSGWIAVRTRQSSSMA